MAFTPVAKRAVGKSITKTMIDLLIDNQADFDGRIFLLEASEVINGSFESDLSNWGAVNTGAGTNAIEETVIIHGDKAFKAASTSGGGYVTLTSSDELAVSTAIDDVFIDCRLRCSGQDQVQGWIQWLNAAGGTISEHQFLDETYEVGEVDAWQRCRGWGRAVALAVAYKIKFQFGDGTVTANHYLDGLTTRINDPYPFVLLDTKVSFYTSSLTGLHNVKVPVFGTAYSAGIDYDETGSEFVSRYIYNADTLNFVDPTGTVDSDPGTSLDQDGETQYERTAGGALTMYYGSWR